LNCNPTATCEVTTEIPVKDVTIFDTVVEDTFMVGIIVPTLLFANITVYPSVVLYVGLVLGDIIESPVNVYGDVQRNYRDSSDPLI